MAFACTFIFMVFIKDESPLQLAFVYLIKFTLRCILLIQTPQTHRRFLYH